MAGGCGVIEYVDMDSWLGVEWKRLGRPAQAPRGLSARRRGGKPSEEDWNSLKDTVLTDKDKLMGNSSVVEVRVIINFHSENF